MAGAYKLDMSNRKMCSWFTVNDWEEILEQVLPLPHVNKVMVKSLDRFDKVYTVKNLRDMISTTMFLL